ncbi:molybdopterin biosynthesis protein MoeB [Sulfurimonas marina]|uniref:Molybdopterin biosynthesis protein MoeB n=1 Tax=Sulfurimonas marina TaxID=2590551 RepID=A0A7M1AWS3_9BACT|nr:molybdopterin biosynthesis protein MoeB [Sulfurimonas marina]QOP41766.1 molybdopterin biosynthesis protein MoeB [Sulfurimonas marina]
MFDSNNNFLYGKDDQCNALLMATRCHSFLLDSDENEHSSNIARSCYNCTYRKWTRESFICVIKNAENI